MNLISVKQLAERLGVSARQCWKLLSAGKLPEPVRIGRSVRWRVSDIDEWVQLGCPDRATFEARQAAGAVR